MAMFIDARRAAYHLIRHHRFSGSVIAILALALGVHLAGLSVLYATLLAPLPYRDPDRLVRIWETNPERGIDRSPVSRGNFADWRELATSFELMGAFGGPSSRMIRFGNGEPEIVYRASGTEDFRRILGVEPAIRNPEGGSLFLSHAFWLRRFGGDARAADVTYTFETLQAPVGGVMPPGFDFPAGADVWGPMSFGRARATRDVNVIARLRPDRSLDQARAELETIAARLEAAHPTENAGWSARVEQLHATIVADARSPVLLLYLAVCLTLIIGIGNAAGLLLSHTVQRRRDIAVRLALGAPHSRLLRQQFLETLLLVSTSMLAGCAVATMILRAVLAAAPPRLPRIHEVGITTPAITTAFAAALCVIAVFMIIGASAWRPEASELLSANRTAGATKGRFIREILSVTQIALCAALLVLSGVVVRSFVSLLRADLGITTDNVLSAQIRQPVLKAGEVVKHYPTRRFARVAEEAVAKASTLPGVESAAVSWYPPVARAGAPVRFRPLPGPDVGPLAGMPEVPDDGRSALVNVVSPDFFRVLGIPNVEGRAFSAEDRLTDDQIDDHDAFRAAGVAIVNETFARLTWPGEQPVGRYLAVQPYASYRSLQVIGVVRDVHARPGVAPEPMIYLPFAQAPMSEVRLFLRASSEPEHVTTALREQLRPLGADVALFDIRPLEDVVGDMLATPRFTSRVMSGLGVAAAILGAAGLFSLLTFVTIQRRREFAIRLAVGAAQRQIATMVVLDAVRLAALGMAVGLVGALAAARMLSHLIPELADPAPTTVAAMGTTVLIVSLVASYVPARQAAQVDPIRALRTE